MDDRGWLRRVEGGVDLVVRLTPKSSTDRIEGARELGPDKVILACRVRAVPEAGKANAALEALIARWLGVAGSKVSVVAGRASRLKTVRVLGDADEIAALAERLA